jgi:hypothetical protein
LNRRLRLLLIFQFLFRHKIVDASQMLNNFSSVEFVNFRNKFIEKIPVYPFFQFDMGGVDIPIWELENLKDRRYDGSAIGFGISYGYQWILSSRWGLEATLGIGYARFDYDIYSVEGGVKIGENKKDYFGPSKGAISITYVIN